MNLHDELTTDPLGLGYAPNIANGADSVLADMLNELRPGIVVNQLVPRWKIKAVLYSTRELPTIAAGTTQEAKTAAMMIDDQDFENLDFQAFPAVSGIFTALVSQGLMAQSSLDAILALTQRPGSRAEQLGLGHVTHEQVAKALRG